MIIKTILLFLGIYVIVLFFAFLSEYTYKKKSIAEIKENAKGIFLKITILFAIMIIVSFIFGLMGIRPE